MLIEENHNLEDFSINSHENGQLEINGKIYQEAVVLRPGSLSHSNADSPAALSAELLLDALDGMPPPEVILVGTGASQMFLHPRITAALAAKGIGLESMATAAACRTYTILQSEGRRVWAWLWP